MTEDQVERVGEAIFRALNESEAVLSYELAPGGLSVLACAAIAAMDPGWQPIQTAPKDKLIDLWVCHPKHGCQRLLNAKWSSKRSGWSTGDLIPGSLNPGWHPTHWRPLPEPPR